MKMLRVTSWISLSFLCAMAALAQYPGRYPPGQYPPGQYPPGQYPPGQTPNPRIPGQTGPVGRGRGGQPQADRGKRSASANALLTTTAGILRRASANQLVIEADDHRVIWYKLAPQIKVLKEGKDTELSEFALGDYLSVDSNSDDDSIKTAVSVTWKKAGTPEDRDEASKTWDLPRTSSVARASAPRSARTSVPGNSDDERPVLRRKDDPPPAPPVEKKAEAPEKKAEVVEEDNAPPPTQIRPPDPKPDADDPGVPVLRRGVPAPRARAAEPVETASTASAPPPAKPAAVTPDPPAANIPVEDDPIIAKAREAAFEYSQTLPNYLVQQMTTRYQSDHPNSGWDALDVVTADLTYQDGTESYKSIKIGNKSVNKPMDEIPGSRSTGEFSTMLEQLFERGAARFRPAGQQTLHTRPAYVFTFEITRELSRWRIEAPSELYYPAMKGTVWIDKETSRVLRIEQQGKGMPALFPFDTVESTADYDFVRLGTSGPYLLPVEAEVLSCQRGSSICSRNKIEFRNYRKFGAQSDITFGQPQ